jgi:uncharacterized protein (TIGR00255 family)
MIRSMTAYGGARVESEHGTLNIEFRTVNNRYLDVALRLPEDLRFAEGAIREQLGKAITRGKVDVRVNFARAQATRDVALDNDYLRTLAEQLRAARDIIPDLRAPRLADVLAGPGAADGQLDPETWLPMCRQACTQALAELQAAREREGKRLADMMLDCAADIARIVDQVEADLPAIQNDYQARITTRLKEALQAANPDGFANIGGPELSARISQESVLFALRIDVAEELSRLRSHISELRHILRGDTGSDTGDTSKGGLAARKGSAGKRLDFLFQEMNREANTLGSKAGALSVTHGAIDLKLLIEQMREQAQNLE